MIGNIGSLSEMHPQHFLSLGAFHLTVIWFLASMYPVISMPVDSVSACKHMWKIAEPFFRLLLC